MTHNNELISPYRTINQFTRIQILPHMMNSDIEDNMNIVLYNKVVGKCNRYGFIEKVNRIEKYEEVIMTPENLSGAINYNITYHCKICIPIENTYIVGLVKAINSELIIVTNGPIIIFIPKTNIDVSIWNISNDFTHIKNKTILKPNDYIKLLIEKTKINNNDIQIKCIGFMSELAQEEEVKQYYGVMDNISESNFIL